MGLLSSSAEATSETNVSDSRTFADNGSNIHRGNLLGENGINISGTGIAKGSTLSLNYNDPQLQMFAIDSAVDSAKEALSATTDSFENTINKFFQLNQSSSNSAEKALAESNAIAKLALAENVTTDEKRLENYLKIGVAGLVAVVFLQSGILKR